ncbi:AMP-dependent synthetase/ligase [Nocardia asteroides]|uniref:AMP-dependent synthetase/ligase n=1 Tax=Nocardia asteroides TaxID=1824 RepID=UPI001E39C33D|nr:long-chain fatty acid--CoA ligase [Nocardia asteroides]UGT64821.1 long-chain fatty acid--CoA ligase [Nocardia asteroides]
MPEFSVPPSFEIPPGAEVTAVVFDHAAHTPGQVVFQRPIGTSWHDVTAAEFADSVLAVAKGLIASGVGAGHRVAILSGTRYEWVLLNFAVWAAGGCVVAIYETSSADQAGWILADSGTTLLVVETAKHRAIVGEVAATLPQLSEILELDGDGIGELRRRGAGLGDEVVHQRRAGLGAPSPATLIYTSGTTGRPKGVCLSHGNLYAESAAARAAMAEIYVENGRTLLFLPLAHIFAQVVMLGAFDSKVVVRHTADWSALGAEFAAFKPTVVFAVPRVFEKIYHGARLKARDEGRGRIFDLAIATAVAYSEALENRGPGPGLRLRHAVFDRLVYGKLRGALGGECTSALSAGAPLGPRLGHFFRGIGLPIYEAYGLTETTAGIIMNTPRHQRIGSVGRPLPGHAVRVAADGELFVRGPVVFGGYWNNPAATGAALIDGWFATGDLGAVDADGYVRITGRKKEIIVTAGGKNVSPALLEDSLCAHPLVDRCMVVGDGMPFIGALITVDPEALPGWIERSAVPRDSTVEQLIEHPVLLAELEAAVAETNSRFSKAEGIRKIRVLAANWSVEGGELTPKMSIKRDIVRKKYAADVDAIYTAE